MSGRSIETTGTNAEDFLGDKLVMHYVIHQNDPEPNNRYDICEVVFINDVLDFKMVSFLLRDLAKIGIYKCNLHPLAK